MTLVNAFCMTAVVCAAWGCAPQMVATEATPANPAAPAASAALAATTVSAAATVPAATPAPVPASAPTLLTLEPAALALTRQRLQSGDTALRAPLAALKRRAERALLAPPRSVTHKTMVPPSGSKHDYMSIGPYWWPNPATSTGLPYVQRDGQRNPQSAGDALDATRLQGMVSDTRDLALAYHFTGDVRYAQKAAVVIRTWFLDPATRMNPSMRYGQSVPGVAEGRGTGIIDTRDLWWVIDAVALVDPSGAGLNATELTALRQWFADYAAWLHTSELGRDEAAAKNNHGMFFDVQLAAYWLSVGETEKARRLVFDAQAGRFAAQFDPQGRMPLELARTRPYHYHTFTLEAATRLARYGQVLATRPPPDGALQATDASCKPPASDVRCPMDLWRVTIDGKSLGGVLDFVAAAVTNPKTWAHATALEPAPPLATALPVLLAAQRALPGGRFGAPLAVLKELAPDDVAWLVWPAP
jgi:Alginate lyase